ncbi:MAG: hypothetical protein J7604_09315 [Sporocytophaga sp.]|uniref:hypothetical protein n=1 Tax=Sporocytophaga sp. TaxID=2231183 RepID=UPI001B05F070|nr:hypothetical protein [Sporocytophaga sp.]MBO9700394.1 hypothetical protein [Sporocytophaga sp.]
MRNFGIFYLALVVLFALSVNHLKAQTISLTKITSLGQGVSETSGLLYINGRIFTHNDSGNKAELYELDTASGAVKRKIVVANASNVDWEDLSSDDNFIYIGDFGNNKGDRKNLRIYRVSREQLLSSENLLADTISFSYNDQKTFLPSLYSTNFDAESFIVAESNIYVFTKNWGNFKTNIYKLPSLPGNYQAIKTDSINVNGLVTCATFNPSDKNLILAGYTFSEDFLCKVYFDNGNADLLQRITINNASGIQIEGICYSGNYYYLSNETSSVLSASLFKISLSDLLTGLLANKNNKNIISGPINNLLILEDNKYQISVFDSSGKKMFYGASSSIATSDWPSGLYIAYITNIQLNYTSIEKLFVEH